MSKSTPKDEKYTPTKYINSVKKVFGGEIDLDPYSNKLANSRIQAKDFFSCENLGMTGHDYTWWGNVFVNPPYSRGNLNIAVSKMQYEFDNNRIQQGILLVPNSTEAKWFQHLWKYPICFTDHRISFIIWDDLRNKFIIEDNPENGSCFVYFGQNKLEFYFEFRKYGHIVYPLAHKYKQFIDID